MVKSHAVVEKIIPGSIAEEAGIEKGDKIISINGARINDIFDYRFLCAEEFLLLRTIKKDGSILDVEVSKEQYDDMGIEFKKPLIDNEKSCTNKCIFCFIDQLPKGMRDTLYFKDDDPRLSFLTGNYVTFTNIKEKELERIIKYRFSPMNISVHTTNPELRKFMLRNRFAGNILDIIKKLTGNHISVNCQIVLCRGINDKNELDRTIADLAELYSGMNSLSVVPVGLTRFREGLYEFEPYDKEASRQVLEQIKKWQLKFIQKYGSKIVYPADEFYIMAGIALPKYEFYEDFPQIENGVGLVTHFLYEFDNYFKEIQNTNTLNLPRKRNISIATGTAAYPFIRDISRKIEKRIKLLKINVYNIKNGFFGENVTVTGLLTGKDICMQLEGKELGDELLISKSMLKSGEEILLDDVNVKEIEDRLEVSVKTVENSGMGFIKNVIGYDSR